MKNTILVIGLMLLIYGCGVSNSKKELLNLSFRNTLYDLYADQGIIIYDLNTEIISMKYYKEGYDYYKTKEPGYYGVIKCDFKIDKNTVSIWFDVGFNKYWRVNNLPELYGKNKVDIHPNDVIISNVDNYKDTMKSKYILDCFYLLEDMKNVSDSLDKITANP